MREPHYPTALPEFVHWVGRMNHDLLERGRELVAEHDFDEVPPHSTRWDHTDGIPPLRWICFHVLEEYARHAGHLDIAVELAGSTCP